MKIAVRIEISVLTGKIIIDNTATIYDDNGNKIEPDKQ